MLLFNDNGIIHVLLLSLVVVVVVSLLYTYTRCLFLNWLSGAQVGVGGVLRLKGQARLWLLLTIVDYFGFFWLLLIM